MSRNPLFAIMATLVFLVAAGLLYLQVWASSNRTEQVWQLSRPVMAGDLLTGDNVRQVSFPASGDALDYFRGDLLGAHAKAAHEMAANTVLYKLDVQTQDLALVTLTIKTPPPVSHGQHVDVFAQQGSQNQLVGRGLIVDQVNGGTVSVWVPADTEPAWITLQANNVALFAARSNGVGVPQSRAQSVQDAIATLGGGSTTFNPSPSPTKKP